MKNISLHDFSCNCNNKRCLRNTIYNSKTCNTSSKQERCFEKYQRLLLKKQQADDKHTDYKWEEVRKAVNKRDRTCRVEAILSREELMEVEYQTDYWLNRYLDCAHEFGRNVHPEYKYDLTHIFLIGRLYHNRLDQYRDPVTNKPITNEERQKWFERIRNGNNEHNGGSGAQTSTGS